MNGCFPRCPVALHKLFLESVWIWIPVLNMGWASKCTGIERRTVHICRLLWSSSYNFSARPLCIRKLEAFLPDSHSSFPGSTLGLCDCIGLHYSSAVLRNKCLSLLTLILAWLCLHTAMLKVPHLTYCLQRRPVAIILTFTWHSSSGLPYIKSHFLTWAFLSSQVQEKQGHSL